jgi:hypothetical protein
MMEGESDVDTPTILTLATPGCNKERNVHTKIHGTVKTGCRSTSPDELITPNQIWTARYSSDLGVFLIRAYYGQAETRLHFIPARIPQSSTDKDLGKFHSS